MTGINTTRVAYNLFGINKNLSRSIQRLSTNKKLPTDSPGYQTMAVDYENQMIATDVIKDSLLESQEYFRTASGSLDEILNILQTMRGVAVAASNENLTSTERNLLDAAEFQPALDSIESVARNTSFKDVDLLVGPWIGWRGKEFLVGPNAGDTMKIYIRRADGTAVDFNADTSSLNIASEDVTTATNASQAITRIDDAIDKVTAFKGCCDISINTFTSFINVNDVTKTNLQSALSAVEDIEVAQEMVRYTKYSVMQQATISMLAQGNLANQNMLALFA